MSPSNPATSSAAPPSFQRWPLIGILAGGVLMTGPFWGLLGTLVGIGWSRRLIEATRAPTPADLHGGVELSFYATMAGIGAFVIGVAVVGLAAVSLVRRPTQAEPRHAS